MIDNGLYRIMSEDVEEIYQEIRCREVLDHVEEYNVISDDEINSNVDMYNDEDISDESDDGINDDNAYWLHFLNWTYNFDKSDGKSDW